MIFFTDFNIPKTTSIGITGLLSNITTKKDSHKGGWAKLLKCQLNNAGYPNVTILDNSDSVLNYDAIVFDLGAEYKGVLNLFGGLDQKCYDRVTDLLHFVQKDRLLFSWQHQMPDLASIIDSRRNNNSTSDLFKSEEGDYLDHVKDLIDSVKTFEHVELKDHILYGDSHTPSVWTPEMLIERQDGRTLFGTVTKGEIFKLLEKYPNMKELTVYLGNIDVRHHLMRQALPYDATIILAQQLLNQLTELSGTIKINVVNVLPIEDESRDIPKTGWYKNTPFFGTWAERSSISEIFNITLATSNFSVYIHPKQFYNEQGQLTFDAMERPGSVHLSPCSYRWDLDENKQRF